MVLALMTDCGETPKLDLDLDDVTPLAPEVLTGYAAQWRQMTGEANGDS